MTRLLIDFNNMNDRHGYWKHHHRSSRIAQPHAEKSCCQNKTKNDAVAIGAGNVDDTQCNSFVKIPFFNGDTQKETTHE